MILSESYRSVQKWAEDFAARELPPEVQTEIDVSGHYPPRLFRALADGGFFGIKVEKRLGGKGLDTLSYALVVEALSRASAITGVYVSGANSLGSGPLGLAGTEEQLQKYLGPVARGEQFPSFGLTEPGAGSDAGGVVTSAEKDGDYYVLNGRKCFITAAPIADFCIVFAKTDPSAKGSRGISAFIVDLKLPGVSFGKPERKMGIIGCPTSDIIFENVRVHKRDLLGEEGRGFSNAMKTLDYGRIGIAAQSVGIGQACLDEAVKFARERRQFGRPIADFQAIGFMIADMATELTVAREQLYNAAILKDAGVPEAGMNCSIAKYFASEMCCHLAAKAVQIHGGKGFVKPTRVERLYRDARITTIYEGTSQIQQLVISSTLLK